MRVCTLWRVAECSSWKVREGKHVLLSLLAALSARGGGGGGGGGGFERIVLYSLSYLRYVIFPCHSLCSSVVASSEGKAPPLPPAMASSSGRV